MVDNRKRVTFCLQPTASFPDGAPQRECYVSDEAHERDCHKCAAEWRREYVCTGRGDRRCMFDCPQHGAAFRPGPVRETARPKP